MKPTSYLAMAITSLTLWLVAGLPAAQQRRVPALNIKSVTARPTAANPRFDDKQSWPMLVGDEYFLKEKWEQGRTYIWNVPKSW